MNIFAIDPGNENSAWVLFDADSGKAIAHGYEDNRAVLQRLYKTKDAEAEHVIEMVACYGMAVGREVFDTVVWIGRFYEAVRSFADDLQPTLMYRREVKMHLCNANNAKDANVRQALIDRFGPGKDRAIGKKKTPGPLYGISGDEWSALAIAVTFADTKLMTAS